MSNPEHYGCHDRPPFVDAYVMHDHIVIKTVGKRECQYTLSPAGPTDKRCEGCKHRETK